MTGDATAPVPPPADVLLLGATGRTGGRVLTQLLARGIPVRAIVRSAERLPSEAAQDPLLRVTEADLASLPLDELGRHVSGCRTVISCLGHTTTSLRGVFGPPHDLVERAVRSVCRAIESHRPEAPVRLILMSSVSVNRPEGADARRGTGERALLWAMRGVLPPARDNQRAADFLYSHIGTDHPFIEWVVVRPDSLVEGEVSEHRVHPEIQATLFRPDHTRMANVAHFMVELTTETTAWRRWRGAMPVIVDEVAA